MTNKTEQSEYPLSPIGRIITPFQEKFSIPRQASLCKHAYGEVNFFEHINVVQALEGIEAFSHLWILFLFHKNISRGYKDKVRPPRLGGNKKIGVFASRSSFRPNHIGMSLVKNLGVKNNKLIVSEVDLLTNTPVIDVKPYLPYADIDLEASAGYASLIPESPLNVTFSEQSVKQLNKYESIYDGIKNLIIEILSQDPRPAYKASQQDTKIYFTKLYDLEIKWEVKSNELYVLSITQFSSTNSG